MIFCCVGFNEDGEAKEEGSLLPHEEVRSEGLDVYLSFRLHLSTGWCIYILYSQFNWWCPGLNLMVAVESLHFVLETPALNAPRLLLWSTKGYLVFNQSGSEQRSRSFFNPVSGGPNQFWVEIAMFLCVIDLFNINLLTVLTATYPSCTIFIPLGLFYCHLQQILVWVGTMCDEHWSEFEIVCVDHCNLICV